MVAEKMREEVEAVLFDEAELGSVEVVMKGLKVVGILALGKQDHQPRED